MRILLLSTSDNQGGAAIAALRLLHALRDAGHDASMLVRDKHTDDPDVTTVNHTLFPKLRDRLPILAANGFTRRNLWLTDAAAAGCDITPHPLFQAADVIHLHWINQGFISLGGLRRILASGKRILWTMHDMWPVTAICHHALDCTKFHTAHNQYGNGCHHCPQLLRPSAKDLSYSVFRQKQKIYPQTRITFVTCSRWLEGQARQSALVKSHTVTSIPNPLPTHIFRPAPKPQGKLRILFSSANVADERKGMTYLIQALNLLTDLHDQVELVVMGRNSDTIQTPFTLHPVPYTTDPAAIAAVNASAHVFVTPSLQENLPNTIMEAMACATPCVGFQIGGIPEMIDHLHNGYVARPADPEDLAQGIRLALRNHSEWGNLARQKVLDTYSPDIIAARYTALYQ